MGKKIDQNQPFDEETIQYLESRGRHGEVLENQRRFPGGDADAADPHESAGEDPESASFDSEDREDTDYDVGGAPLPGRILDGDTGRVIPLSDRSNGAEGLNIVDPNTGETVPDPDYFPPDIVEEVEGIKNVTELKKRLKEEKIDFTGKTERQDLEDALIIGLTDKRNGVVPQVDDSDQFIDPADGATSLDPATVETTESK